MSLPFVSNENDFAREQLAAFAEQRILQEASYLIPMSQRLRRRGAQPNLLRRTDERNVEPKCKTMASAALEYVKIHVYLCWHTYFFFRIRTILFLEINRYGWFIFTYFV